MQQEIPFEQPIPRLWENALSLLRERLTPQIFSAWIEPVEASAQDNRLLLMLPNQYFYELFVNEYLGQVQQAIVDAGGAGTEIEIACDEEDKSAKKKSNQSLADIQVDQFMTEAPSLPNLDERYTFESYVVGPSNQLAHAACRAVAKEPAGNYNPLFIYGGVGLGKTHLLHAIGWEALAIHKDIRVVYLSSEQFMNEMIAAVRLDKLVEFRSRYRDQCDILLIDDIQFIAGKKMTQEEFFHTFNFLYSSNKHIVVTSDKYPQEIPALEERLRTRFQSGLIADIQEPELETRMAIITQKAEQEQLRLSNDVVLFLAGAIQSNIRELEGSLTRLSAFAQLSGEEITLHMAQKVLQNILPKDRHAQVSIESIQKMVANHYGVGVEDLVGGKRHKAVLIPRQVSMFLCRKLAQASYPEIGDKFGGKDHSTVINACQKIEKLRQQDLELNATLQALEARLT
jgi:chromosomal replication initiator protein